ncbi:MAG: GNAT family N-acetyltransferase [archaeon]
MPYEIRLANKKEALDCIRLSRKSWPHWWANNEKVAEKHIKRRVKEKKALVAVLGKKVVAFVLFDETWNQIHLEDLYVEKKYRRNGIASRLINAIEEKYGKRGFKKIMSDLDTTNKISYKFHLKNGFKKVGFIKDLWGEKDSYVFSKSIRQV